MTTRKRTEDLNPKFVNGWAAGWAFGVSEAFRTNLDMTYDKRIDSPASKAKEQELGRKLKANEKVFRFVWTQGAPPAYSFARGHMFHDPQTAHIGAWSDALPTLRRTIVILDAKADDGSLSEVLVRIDDDDATVRVESDTGNSQEGWVDFEVYHYNSGQLVSREKSSRTQAGFVELLRTGNIDTAA